MTKRVPQIFVYRDRKGEWRWRLKAANGKIVLESGESFKRRPSAESLERLGWMMVAAAEDLAS